MTARCIFAFTDQENQCDAANPQLIGVRQRLFLNRYAVNKRSIDAVEVANVVLIVDSLNDAVPSRYRGMVQRHDARRLSANRDLIGREGERGSFLRPVHGNQSRIHGTLSSANLLDSLS